MMFGNLGVSIDTANSIFSLVQKAFVHLASLKRGLGRAEQNNRCIAVQN